MGDHYPITVIVTHCNESDLLKVHAMAFKHLPRRTSPVVQCPGNGWRSFMVATDGFKIGGDLHEEENQHLKDFLAEVVAHELDCHVLIVSETDFGPAVQEPRKYLGMPSDDPFGDS